jgi:hypothetical protein
MLGVRVIRCDYFAFRVRPPAISRYPISFHKAAKTMMKRGEDRYLLLAQKDEVNTGGLRKYIVESSSLVQLLGC